MAYCSLACSDRKQWLEIGRETNQSNICLEHRSIQLLEDDEGASIGSSVRGQGGERTIVLCVHVVQKILEMIAFSVVFHRTGHAASLLTFLLLDLHPFLPHPGASHRHLKIHVCRDPLQEPSLARTQGPPLARGPHSTLCPPT